MREVMASRSPVSESSGPSTSHLHGSLGSGGYSMLNSGLSRGSNEGMRDPNHLHSPFVHPPGPQMCREHDEMNCPSNLARQHQLRQAEQHAKDLADVRRQINEFWPLKKKMYEENNTTFYREVTKNCVLPMARVKKIMKIDDDLQGQMIAQDAPLFLAKAAELFIEELTLKAWSNTEELRRKTLQKNDITFAVSKNEHFDFLIDIVPREEVKVKYQEDHVGQVIDGQQIQHVTLDGQDPNVNINNLMFQLENGQVVSASQIGQPIQLGPQGSQTIQLGGHGQHSQTAQVRLAPPTHAQQIHSPPNGQQMHQRML